MKITRFLHLGMLASVFVFTGCASIVSKSNWPVTFKSDPSGAKIVISDENGNEIHRGVTPATVTLPADSGFFSKAKYYIDIKEAGYQDSKGVLTAKINGWYFGNIIFGGLIGFVIVDPATGAMWKLPPLKTVSLAKIENAALPPVVTATPSVTTITTTNVPPIAVETKASTNSVPQQ